MRISDERKNKVVQFIKTRYDETMLLSPEVIFEGLQQISKVFNEEYNTVYVDVTYEFMNHKYIYVAIANQEDIYRVKRII